MANPKELLSLRAGSAIRASISFAGAPPFGPYGSVLVARQYDGSSTHPLALGDGLPSTPRTRAKLALSGRNSFASQ